MANLYASFPSSSSSFTTSAACGCTRNTISLTPFSVRFLSPFPRSTPFPTTAATTTTTTTTTTRPTFEVLSQRGQARGAREEIESPQYASPEEFEKANQKREKTDRKKYISLVPLDQRWLFEEAELNGPDIWNTTWYPRAKDHVNTEKPWYIVDATDKILGRLASTIAIHIRGKNLATYTPSVDMGAFVIVVNAEKVAVSGKKRTQKLYRRHSGRPGGMTVETFDHLQQRIPERIIEHAVRGMLPKGRLGRALFNHLKVYKGPDHPHEAQKPVELPIRDKRIMKRD